MLFSLNVEQLNWVLEGTRYSEKTVAAFHDHYVIGIPKGVVTEKYGMTVPFAAKKWAEFEKLLRKKCAQNNIKIATILYDEADREAVFSYDVVSKKKNTT